MFLFFIIAFLIAYGSLYPFEFVWPADNSDSLQRLFQTWGSYTHQGDILANIVLFVPFGVTGVQMLAPKLKKILAIFIILFFGLFLGVILQVGQVYMPSRDANLSDAVLNFIGTIVGVIIALRLKSNKLRLFDIKSNFNSFPVILLFSWLAYRLMPLVPSIDLQEIKKSIKPLFVYPKLELVRIFHDITAWLIAFYILFRSSNKYFTTRYFTLGILLCFILEIIIVENKVSLSNVIGATLALILWKIVFSHINNISALLAMMMVVVLFASGFAPYKLAYTTQTFQFLPFYGFLGGSMLVNTSSLLEKVFLYGSLIWLLQTSGLRLWVATIITVGVTLCIEVGQVFLVDHLPEITDPILVFLLGFLASTIAKDSKISNDSEVPFKLFTVKIFLQTPFLNQQIEGETVTSNSFPVQIGRSGNPANTNNNGYRISLEDYEPYQLSRSHFSIEQIDNEILIKDLDSTKGTLVNGKQIGKRHAKQQTIKLKMGENEVIAGKNDSNFNFRILVEPI